jgi:flagellar export protein FliJ
MTRRGTVSKVLELKEMTKEQIESEVRKILDRLSREESRLNSLEDTYKKTVTDFNCKQDKGCANIQEMELFHDYFSHLIREIDKQKKVVLRRIIELEDKQKAMLEVYKEKRLFEILRDRIVNEETKQTEKSSQRDMDFQYLTRRARR